MNYKYDLHLQKNLIEKSQKAIQNDSLVIATKKDFNKNSDITEEDELKISKLLEENKFHADVYVNNQALCVEIENGDWKHDHIRLKHFMKDQGYMLLSSTEQPSNDDCYSAIHAFIKTKQQEKL